MVRHIVLFELAEEAEGNSKKENALRMKNELEALRKEIPEIVEINVMVNSDDSPKGNSDVLLDSVFRDFEDLRVYATHPAHLKVVDFISKVRVGRAAIDYEF